MGQSIRLIGVDHRYVGTEEGAGAEALRSVDLTITAGDFAVLMGPSGSGKSTLLHLIGAIDRPTRGRVLIGEKEISSMSEGALTSFRRRSVGFVFQFFNLPILRSFAPLRMTCHRRSTVAQRRFRARDDTC